MNWQRIKRKHDDAPGDKLDADLEIDPSRVGESLTLVTRLGIQSFPDDTLTPEKRAELTGELEKLRPSKELVDEVGLDQAEIISGFADLRVQLDPRNAEDYL